MAKVTIQNGQFQSPTGALVANGFLQLQLSAPAVVSGTGQVAPSLVTIALDANGQAAATAIWGNDSLTPSGTTYVATLSDSNRNQITNFGNWSFTGSTTIELNTMVPTSTGATYPSAVLKSPGANQTISDSNLLPATSNTTQSLGSAAAPWLATFLNETIGNCTLQADTGRYGNNAIRFQATGANQSSEITLMPSGINTESGVRLYNTSDPNNAGALEIDLTARTVTFLAQSWGTGLAPNVLDLSALATTKVTVLNVATGIQISSAATTGNVLRGNGTNFVSATLAAADLSNGVTGSGAVVLAASPTLTGTTTTSTLAFTTLNSVVPNANYGGGLSTRNNALQSQVVVSGTEYYVTSSGITMPATFKGGIVAGSTFVWRVTMTKTAAGTGTFQIKLKHGTNGSIADTTDTTLTVGTQTAIADVLTFDLVVTFTSATAYYFSFVPYQQAATATGFGLVYPAVASVQTGTVSALTTNIGSTIWGLSFVSTTGTPTITVPMVQGEAYNIT